MRIIFAPAVILALQAAVAEADVSLRDHPIATATAPTYLDSDTWTASTLPPPISDGGVQQARGGRLEGDVLHGREAVCGLVRPEGAPVGVLAQRVASDLPDGGRRLLSFEHHNLVDLREQAF